MHTSPPAQDFAPLRPQLDKPQLSPTPSSRPIVYHNPLPLCATKGAETAHIMSQQETERPLVFRRKCRARVRLSGDAHLPTFGLRKSTSLGCTTWHPQLAQPNTPGLSNLRSSPSPSKDAWSSFALSPKPTGKTSHYQSNAKCRTFTTHARRFETWNKRSSRVQSGRRPMRNLELHAVLTATRASSNCNSPKC